MKTFFSHHWARFVLYILGKQKWLNFLVLIKRPHKAVALINAAFFKMAPKDERIASGNWMLRKFDFFGAAQLLLECKPRTTAAILKEFVENKEFKPHSFKAQIFINLWLSVPPFAPKLETTIAAIDLFSWACGMHLEEMLKKIPAPSSVLYLEKSKSMKVNMMLPNLPLPVAIPILFGLKKKNPEQFMFRFTKLPPEMAGQVNMKIMELEGHIAHHEVHAGLTRNLGHADLILGKITSPPPPSEPPDEEKPKPKGEDGGGKPKSEEHGAAEPEEDEDAGNKGEDGDDGDDDDDSGGGGGDDGMDDSDSSEGEE